MPAADIEGSGLELCGRAARLARERESFDALGLPWFWLPGNHDAGPLMHGVIGRGRPMIRSICAGSWQIVMLDSTVAGQVGGSLGAAELALLDRLLGAEPARHRARHLSDARRRLVDRVQFAA